MSDVHCWTSEGEHIEATFGWRSAEYAEYITNDGPHRVCLLPENHGGPHEWIDAKDIMIRFVGDAKRRECETEERGR
jgi:hypothetical protein